MAGTDDTPVHHDYENFLHVAETPAVIDMYNKWTHTYDNDLHPESYTAPIVLSKTVLKYVKDGDRLLDVAAGSGQLARELRERGFKGTIDGLDPAEEFAQRAIDAKLYEKFYYDLITEEPCSIAAESYDHVACCGGFIPGHIHYKAIVELLRICKKGGHVFIGLRHDFIKPGTKLSGMESWVDERVKAGAFKLVDKFTYDNHFRGMDGMVFVIEKI